MTSSDPRIQFNNSLPPADTHDTNSGVLSRLDWNGSTWTKFDVVRGLPRSEENHSSNGMALDTSSNTLYVMQGGHTNFGSPSQFFGHLPEYALSTALLTIDLDAIGQTTYDLPTLDDEDRAGPNDANDPFGGNGGKNQAILVPGGPVQVYSTGWRNAYDVVLTADGRLYTVDNGGNGGFGGAPAPGDCSNATVEGGSTFLDTLHYIDSQGYYGGHPNPTRGSMANTWNASNPQSPVSVSNPVECQLVPTFANGHLVQFNDSTNGLAEYTASNFSGEMTGNLLAAGFNGEIYRIQLNAAGTDIAAPLETLFQGFGTNPLDVVAVPDDGLFPGTIWAVTYGSNGLVVFEPADYDGGGGGPCDGTDTFALDEDGDGYSNGDEIDAGSDPCNAGSKPADADNDFLSDVNDNDDDNDGATDDVDIFALDADNGQSTTLPVFMTWNNGEPQRGGILGLGFTGVMQNGTDYLQLFDPDKIIPGGAPGVFAVTEVPAGDAYANLDSQLYGMQFGVDVDPSTAPFIARVRLIGPLGASPEDDMSMGLFFGTGRPGQLRRDLRRCERRGGRHRSRPRRLGRPHRNGLWPGPRSGHPRRIRGHGHARNQPGQRHGAAQNLDRRWTGNRPRSADHFSSIVAHRSQCTCCGPLVYVAKRKRSLLRHLGRSLRVRRSERT